MIHVQIEVSARHLHISAADWRRLFGPATIKPKRYISQPGQYIAQQRVALIGPAGALKHIGIVGPFRQQTLVELTATEAHLLGLSKISLFGRNYHGAKLKIVGPHGSIIRAWAGLQARHLHLDPVTARRWKVHQGQLVSLQVAGSRAGRLDRITVRIDKNYAPRLHLDTDESNALGVTSGQRGKIIIAKS